MEDFGVKLAKLCTKEDDIIVVTFSKDMDIDECSDCLSFIKNQYPQYNFLGAREDIIKEITIIEGERII